MRINVDVLNAQQQLFSTLRDLARARYDVLLNDLRLKAVAGALVPADVAAVNALLSPPAERNFPSVTDPGAVRGVRAGAGRDAGARNDAGRAAQFRRPHHQADRSRAAPASPRRRARQPR